MYDITLDADSSSSHGNLASSRNIVLENLQDQLIEDQALHDPGFSRPNIVRPDDIKIL